MLSLKSAEAIYKRFLILCNGQITCKNIMNLNDEDMKKIEISRQKISYIRSITKFFIGSLIDFKNLSNLSQEEVINELVKIRGVGN